MRDAALYGILFVTVGADEDMVMTELSIATEVHEEIAGPKSLRC